MHHFYGICTESETAKKTGKQYETAEAYGID